jgi:hypothetical protein
VGPVWDELTAELGGGPVGVVCRLKVLEKHPACPVALEEEENLGNTLQIILDNLLEIIVDKKVPLRRSDNNRHGRTADRRGSFFLGYDASLDLLLRQGLDSMCG